MPSIVYAFIKVFSNEDHREQFLNGSLYMNKLKYFIKHENQNTDGRNDPFESIIACLQPERTTIYFGKTVIPPSNLVAPVVIRSNKNDNTNVLCLISIDNNGFEQLTVKNIEQFKTSLVLDNKIRALGEYAAVIIDPNEFLARVDKTVEKKYHMQRGFVKYYDFLEYSNRFPEDKILFYKRIEYSYQKEYRIAIDCENKTNEVFRLEIGNIRDICQVTKTSEINNKLQVRST